MYVPKSIQRLFYWTIILLMLFSMSFPSGLVAAQTPGKIQKSPATSAEIQQIPILSELKSKQAETPLPFNFPDEQLVKNKIEEGEISFSADLKQTVLNEEIKSGHLPTKPFVLKSQQDKIEAPTVISGASLKKDRAYFDSLIQKLNPLRPQSLTGAKSLGWSKISFEKPLSIKELVKQVPNELADKIIFPETEIVKGETSREKRTAPLIRLQPEYLIFFAKEGGVNPIGQNLKINNHGEGQAQIFKQVAVEQD